MLIIPVLLVFVLLFIVYNRVRLPVNVNSLINEIKKEELPEFVTGKTGFANNNDIKIAYEILDSKKPNGETIVLINGHGQSRLVWPTYFYQPFLDQGYSVIKYDNRGLGESDWIIDWSKESPYTLEDMATDAIAILDSLNIEKAHFIGMSMGAMISQRIAISYPTRISTLTSVMSTGFYDDPALVSVSKRFYSNIIAITLLYGRKLKTNSQKMKFFLSTQRLMQGKGDNTINDKEILQKAYFELKVRKGFNSKVSDQHSLAIKISGSRYEELKNIKTPSMVIHGINDPLIKIEHAKKYATLIPNAKTLFIKGMGHDLPEKYIPDIFKSILKIITLNSTN
jgi:pimeloyl-ACP methyl ester carboxylesterase